MLVSCLIVQRSRVPAGRVLVIMAPSALSSEANDSAARAKRDTVGAYVKVSRAFHLQADKYILIYYVYHGVSSQLQEQYRCFSRELHRT